MPEIRRSALGTFAIGFALVSAVAGCNQGPDYTPSAAAKRPAKALKGNQTVAVVRLNDPTVFAEASDAEILSGMAHDGVPATAVTLKTYDAKGDRSALPGLIDAASRDGAALVLALSPEAATAAAAKEPKVPVIFAVVGDPVGLGLGKSDEDHRPTFTGVYTPFRNALMVQIARGSTPKPKKLGILFNPDDPLSVAHKDALLKTDWGDAEALPGAFHSESEVPDAVKAMVAKKADGIILTYGIGRAAGAAVAEASKAKVPTFGFLGDHARAGAIVARPSMSRWAGFEVGRRAARVLQGEPPKQIPFLTGDNYETYVNTSAAKAIGVTIIGAIMRDPKNVSNEAPPAAAKASP